MDSDVKENVWSNCEMRRKKKKMWMSEKKDGENRWNREMEGGIEEVEYIKVEE